MARTAIATDNFNRASIGTDWTNLNSDWGSMTIYLSTVVSFSTSQSGANRQAARWTGAGTFTDNQYSKIKIGTFSFLSNSQAAGVIVRASADTNANRDYYEAVVFPDSGGPTYTTELNKLVNGTLTTIFTAAITWVSGDTLSIEADGTTISVYRNDVALGGSWTQTDSSLTTGLPGASGAGNTSFPFDDWEGGNLGSAAPNILMPQACL